MVNGHFTVGDKVRRIGFVDCFGKQNPEVPGLTVQSVRKIDNSAPHIRVVAIGADGFGYYEGAERFFAMDS